MNWLRTSLGSVPDGEIPHMFHESVNMSPGELRAWAKNPWHKLASTSTGLASLRRIPGLLEKRISDWTSEDYKFARKVLGFNKRHLTGKTHNLFGKPARAGVPWSKRAIALKNWGHDPSKSSSPAFEEHREWLKEHGRKSNPADLKKTPAKPSERIRGSKRNKKGSAATASGDITLSESTIRALRKKVKEHNESEETKVTLGQLKAVYRRGSGAFSTSHHPRANRHSWSMGRVNSFLRRVKGGDGHSQDDDLIKNSRRENPPTRFKGQIDLTSIRKKRERSQATAPSPRKRAGGIKPDLSYAKLIRDTDFKAQYDRDQRAMLQHIEQAQKAMRKLIKQVAPLAEQAKRTAKKKGTKPSGEMMKLLKESAPADRFLKAYIGEEGDFKSSKSWRNTALYRVRDAALGDLTQKDAIKALSPIKAPVGAKTPTGAKKVWDRTPAASTLGKGYMWSSLARGPESLLEPGQFTTRNELPPEVLMYLPATLALSVKNGTVQNVTDRFKNQRDTFEKKRLEQRNLIAQTPYIHEKVLRDISSQDAMTALAAAATLLMQETGIRPSNVGSTKPLPLTAPQQVSVGSAVILERQPQAGSDQLARKAGRVVRAGDMVSVQPLNDKGKPSGDVVTYAWDDKALKLEQPIYGAVNLAPEHIEVGPRGLKLKFRGKHGVENVAATAHPELVRVLVQYKDNAERNNLEQVFLTPKGEPLTKGLLDKYLRESFPGVSSTHFRKLRGTREVHQALRKALKDAQPKLRKAKGASQKEEIVLGVIKSAFAKGQESLSHEGESTTINSYVNPEVLLRFVTEGGFRKGESLEDLIFTERPLTLNYSPSEFAG